MSITLKKRRKRRGKLCKPDYMISLRENGMIQETSIEAYYSMQHKLGDRQRFILNIIKVYPGVSNKDISNITKLPINTVTPRVKELRALGMVDFHH